MFERFKELALRGRWWLRAARGQDVYYRPELTRPFRIEGGAPGTGYGAWAVCTDLLTPESVVYSAGIGEDISFDLALIERYGVTVHAFDPTPATAEWLRRQVLPEGFVYHPYGLAAYDGVAVFYPPRDPSHVSHTMIRPATSDRPPVEVPVRCLRTLMQRLGHRRIDLLKMDIEGAEYDVIDDLARSHIEVGQVLVEFHHRMPGLALRQTRQAVGQLREMGLRLVYVSPRGEEYLFVQEALS